MYKNVNFNKKITECKNPNTVLTPPKKRGELYYMVQCVLYSRKGKPICGDRKQVICCSRDGVVIRKEQERRIQSGKTVGEA